MDENLLKSSSRDAASREAGGPPTRWWFVRHAPVIGVEGKIYGGDDVECDTNDPERFAGLAKLLPSGAVWMTSHLSRAKLTAAAIGQAGLDHPEPLEEPNLGEQSFGDWQGHSWDDMRKRNPALYDDFWRDPVRNRPPNGESFQDLIDRTGNVIERFTETHKGRDIVAVCHGGTIRAALSHALGLEPGAGMSFTIHTLSITRLEHIEGGLLRGKGANWRIVHVNTPPAVPMPGFEDGHIR